MSPHPQRIGRALLLSGIMALMLAGCATKHLREEGLNAIDTGQFGEGFTKLRAAVAEDPSNTQLRAELRAREDQVMRKLITAADNDRINGNFEAARAGYRNALAIDPAFPRATVGLAAVDQAERHAARMVLADQFVAKGDRDGALAVLRSILEENPQHVEARLLNRKLVEDQARESIAGPSFRLQGRKPVTLEFRDATLKLVFEALSKAAGINILLDRDLKGDTKTTIFVKDATVEDAIDLLLLQNQLEKKVISDNTLFIYPNQPNKVKDYQDLKIRNFQLTNADAKQVQTMLKTLLKTRDLFVDEKTNSVIMRDTPEAIRLAEKLINTQDLAEPEVLLEVEVLEVNRSNLEQLGINWPTSLALSLTGTPAQTSTTFSNGTPIQTNVPATNLTLDNIRHVNSSLIQVGSLSGSIDFQKQIGDTNTLSSPRIRVRNKEKAKILIGDRVPVITNSVTPVATGTPVVTGSVTYLDVGLKLDVEPTIYLDDDIAIKLNLEVSNIAKTVQGQGGTLAYQIGTRTASTVLRLKDGETQIMAGLISDDDRKSMSGVDGLSELPILGKLFGSTNTNKAKTEIVLTMTPHLIRGVRRPDATDMEFWTGTETTLRTRPSGALSIGKVVQGKGAADAANANVTSAGSVTAPGAPARAAGAPRAPATPTVTPAAGAAPVVAPAPAAGTTPTSTPTPSASPAPAPAPTVAPVVAPVASAGAAVATPGALVLSWRAPNGTIRVGQEVALGLQVRSGRPVGSLPSTLHYDPSAFSVVRSAEGDYFRRDGGPSTFHSSADAAAGLLTIEASQPDGGKGAGGTGVLFSVVLKALKASTAAEVSLTSANPVAPDGSTLPVALPAALALRVVE